MSDHGYGAYSHGCRCDICREAKRAYVAARRATGAEPTRVGEVPRPRWNDEARRGRTRAGLRRVCLRNVQHGTTGYRRGCRCWDCTDASAASARERYERTRTA